MSAQTILIALVVAATVFVILSGFVRKPLGWFGIVLAVVASLASAIILQGIFDFPIAFDNVASSLADESTAVETTVLDATETSSSSISDVEEPVTTRPIAVHNDGYVSSDKCRSCHTEHYDTWHASHHRTMTQVPTKDSVIADFENHVIQRSGRDFRFFHKDDEFFMEMKKTGQPNLSKTFKIVLSTGAHHQQAFWCETEEGRSLGKIPFIWINSEQRWVPYGSIFLMPPSQLSMPTGVWNRNCIKCHVVNGRPRQGSGKNYDSLVAEFGISCEACHGPGEAHIAEHSSEKLDSLAKDVNLINPANLSHKKSSQVCGQCHAVFDFYDEHSEEEFNRNGFAFRPGDDLSDTRHVFRMGHDEDLPVVKQKLQDTPEFYQRQFWSDGMVRVSGREYNGLLESPCFQRGKMSCLSCHDMHPSESDKRPSEWADDQLGTSMHGEQACIQCHTEFESDETLIQHTHHPRNSAGSSCYNCHMPHTTLGLMKAMRSHTIDSPNVSTTLETGRPNACNLCHLDKTLAWTASKLEAGTRFRRQNFPGKNVKLHLQCGGF